jgi:hypothetical protein
MAEVVGGCGSKQGGHAPARAKNALERASHALGRRRRWKNWRPSVEAGDAGEPVGEERVV